MGCQSVNVRTSPNHSPALEHTYLVHLPGIGGRTSLDINWVQGLSDGHVAGHVELYDWTRPNWWLWALRAYEHNRAESRMIADRITARVRDDPQANIILTAWSGGCQVAIWALEDLPEDIRVQSVVMVAPSMRPNYDMSRALSHVRGSLFAVTSPGDWFILGGGTLVFGVSDGSRTAGAGMIGFEIPQGSSEVEYKKLVQLAYAAKWLQYGDLGGHAGAVSARFARDVVVPLLKDDAKKVNPPTTRPATQELPSRP
ncbi:MAG TPA: hypothetical protein VH370_03165 [Humisphaera sp.]|nr:hypothetical protein [Humisphaera sp.]